MFVVPVEFSDLTLAASLIIELLGEISLLTDLLCFPSPELFKLVGDILDPNIIFVLISNL
jgi:hypothetical protein